MGNGSMAVAEGKSLVSDDGASFMDLGEDKKLLKEEKAFAKKKVAKLEHVRSTYAACQKYVTKEIKKPN